MRHPTAAQSVAFLPDKNTLVAADADGAITFWDRNTQLDKSNPNLASNLGAALKITFSPDGGMKQLARWVRLHPYNISQKVAIIVEHFHSRT
jgi:WD40 repeat protein